MKAIITFFTESAVLNQVVQVYIYFDACLALENSILFQADLAERLFVVGLVLHAIQFILFNLLQNMIWFQFD